MHSSWINQCEWFSNIMKEPAPNVFWKWIVIFVKTSCGDSGVGNLGFEQGQSGAPQDCFPAGSEVGFSGGCAERSSLPLLLIKLLNRTPHLIITSRHAHWRGLASSWVQKHHIPPQRTLLRANYTGPYHSQGLVKLDSLCFSGFWMNLSNLNFVSLPYFSWALHVKQSEELFHLELLARDTQYNLISYHHIQSLRIQCYRGRK